MYAKSSNCIIRVFVIQVIIVQRFSCKLNKLELDQKKTKQKKKQLKAVLVVSGQRCYSSGAADK